MLITHLLSGNIGPWHAANNQEELNFRPCFFPQLYVGHWATRMLCHATRRQIQIILDESTISASVNIFCRSKKSLMT
jgi:hypothetical protein